MKLLIQYKIYASNEKGTNENAKIVCSLQCASATLRKGIARRT